jgi:hypothetical protein
MESLHSVFQAAQTSVLNFAALAGIGAGCFARAGIAGRSRSAVSNASFSGIMEYRKQMLVLRTPPHVLVWMVCETGGQRQNHS